MALPVFVQTRWKSMGFVVFSIKDVERALVAQAKRSTNCKNNRLYNKNTKR